MKTRKRKLNSEASKFLSTIVEGQEVCICIADNICKCFKICSESTETPLPGNETTNGNGVTQDQT